MTQLPSSHRLDAAPPLAMRVRPKTYSVAIYLVVAIVLLEVGMLISVFWLRSIVVPVSVQIPKALLTRTANPNTPTAYQNTIGPLSPTPVKAPELPNLPALALAPAPLLSVPTMSSRQEQVGTLNDEAQVLLHQNDLKHAAIVLNSAEDIDPENPTTLKNLAETYYLLNDSVRAKIYWQRLVDLGPGVGPIYATAEDHVLLLNSTADANTLTERSGLPRSIYIDQVEKTPVETSTGEPQFSLRTVLMRKDPKLPFDQTKLQPFVIFYRQMPTGELAPDLNQHKGAFEDTFLFWKKLREPFNVTYLMPVPSAADGEYYGFVIGIYYNKILQDVRSVPSDLIERQPLPQAIE